MPSAQKQFLPFLDAKFPKLARRYREWFSKSSYAPETYRREISARVAALRRKYNLEARPVQSTNPAEAARQLELGLEFSVALKRSERPGNACAAQAPLKVLA
jgi:3-polyprenyl-4-hydroxybenzoate decarboxylase